MTVTGDLPSDFIICSVLTGEALSVRMCETPAQSLRHAQGGCRGCGPKMEISGTQGSDGFQWRLRLGVFPSNLVILKALLVLLFHSLELCVQSLWRQSGVWGGELLSFSCSEFSGCLPSSPILSPNPWLLLARRCSSYCILAVSLCWSSRMALLLLPWGPAEADM